MMMASSDLFILRMMASQIKWLSNSKISPPHVHVDIFYLMRSSCISILHILMEYGLYKSFPFLVHITILWSFSMKRIKKKIIAILNFFLWKLLALCWIYLYLQLIVNVPTRNFRQKMTTIHHYFFIYIIKRYSWISIRVLLIKFKSF